MTDSPLTSLSNVALTVEDTHAVTDLLKEFFEFSFFSDHQEMSQDKLLSTFIAGKNLSEARIEMLKALPDTFWKLFTRDNLYERINELTEYVRSVPHIVLYVPIILPQDEIKKLSNWIRTNVDEKVLMDIKIDPTAVGGCKFAWKGMYHDFSIRYFVKKHKSELVSMVGKHGDD